MRTLADRLAFALDAAGLKPADLARACGVKPPSVSDWLTGKTKTMKAEPLRKAALALHVDRDWLETGNGSPNTGLSIPTERALAEHPDGRRLREAPDVAWRDLGTAMRDVAGWVVVEVATDELAPGICRGDQVVIDPAEPLEPGKPLICQDAEGAWHLRRMRVITGSRWEAYAESGAWAPLPGESLQRALRIVRVIKAV